MLCSSKSCEKSMGLVRNVGGTVRILYTLELGPIPPRANRGWTLRCRSRLPLGVNDTKVMQRDSLSSTNEYARSYISLEVLRYLSTLQYRKIFISPLIWPAITTCDAQSVTKFRKKSAASSFVRVLHESQISMRHPVSCKKGSIWHRVRRALPYSANLRGLLSIVAPENYLYRNPRRRENVVVPHLLQGETTGLFV